MEEKNKRVKQSNTKVKAIEGIGSIILIYLSIMIVFGALRDVLGKAFYPDFFKSSDGNYLFVGIANIALCVLIPMIVKKNTNKSIRRYFYVRRLRISDLLMVFLTAYAVPRLVMHFEGLLLSGRMTIEEASSTNKTLIFFLSAVLIAPVAEEILMRYALIEHMRKNFSRMTILLFTGLLFAFLHGYNVQGFTCTFLSFLFVSVYYLRTGNLLFTIIWHVSYNLILYIMESKVFDEFWNSIYYVENGFIIYRPVGLVGLIILSIAGILYYYLCGYSRNGKSNIG